MAKNGGNFPKVLRQPQETSGHAKAAAKPVQPTPSSVRTKALPYAPGGK